MMSTAYHYLLDLAKEATPPQDGIVSRTIFQDPRVKAVLFGFAPGQALTEHTTAKPAMLIFLQGEAQLGLGTDQREARAGTWLHLPPHQPHAITARSAVVMLLLLFQGDQDLPGRA
jgi:quercetin dioxygenase-like cupin family protein